MMLPTWLNFGEILPFFQLIFTQNFKSVFHSRTFYLPYLSNGWSNWCETKRKWVDRMLRWLGYLWPWPLTLTFDLDLWPWIFKVKLYLGNGKGKTPEANFFKLHMLDLWVGGIFLHPSRWHWVKVTKLPKRDAIYLVPTIKWEPLIHSLQNIVGISPLSCVPPD